LSINLQCCDINILKLGDSEPLQVQICSYLYLSQVCLQTSASIYMISKGLHPDTACEIYQVRQFSKSQGDYISWGKCMYTCSRQI